jgi:hypothetical protein
LSPTWSNKNVWDQMSSLGSTWDQVKINFPVGLNKHMLVQVMLHFGVEKVGFLAYVAIFFSYIRCSNTCAAPHNTCSRINLVSRDRTDWFIHRFLIPCVPNTYVPYIFQNVLLLLSHKTLIWPRKYIANLTRKDICQTLCIYTTFLLVQWRHGC